MGRGAGGTAAAAKVMAGGELHGDVADDLFAEALFFDEAEEGEEAEQFGVPGFSAGETEAPKERAQRTRCVLCACEVLLGDRRLPEAGVGGDVVGGDEEGVADELAGPTAGLLAAGVAALDILDHDLGEAGGERVGAAVVGVGAEDGPGVGPLGVGGGSAEFGEVLRGKGEGGEKPEGEEWKGAAHTGI